MCHFQISVQFTSRNSYSQVAGTRDESALQVIYCLVDAHTLRWCLAEACFVTPTQDHAID